MKKISKRTIALFAALSMILVIVATAGLVQADEVETELIVNETFDESLDGWGLMANNSGNRVSYSDGKAYASIVGFDQDDDSGNNWLASYGLGSTRGAAFRPDNYESYSSLTDYTLSFDFNMDELLATARANAANASYWNAAFATDILIRQSAAPDLTAQTYAEGYMVKLFGNRISLYDSATKTQLNANGDMNYYPLTLGTDYNIKVIAEGNNIKVDIAPYVNGEIGTYRHAIDYTDERENAPTSGYFMIVNKLDQNTAGYYNIPPVENYMWMDNIRVEAPITALNVRSDITSGVAGVSVDPTINLTFNSAVSAEALNAALTVKDKDENSIATQVVLSADGKQAAVTFANSLDYRTKYTLTVANSLSSVSGLSLENDFVLQFTTAAKTKVTENILNSTFDSGLDGWAQVSGISGNRVSWSDGKVYTTVVSRDNDDYSGNTGTQASNRAAAFRPVAYEQYNGLTDYRVSYDFELTNNITVNPQMFGAFIYLRVTGEPNVGAQSYPSGYAVRIYNGTIDLLDNLTGSLTSAPYKINQNTVYNFVAEAVEDTVNVYIAAYDSNGVLGEYSNVISYTDERENAPKSGYFLVNESLVYNYLNSIDPTEDAMWLDNIKVDEYISDLTVSTNITDGETDVSTDKEIKLYFNSAVNAETLRNNITVMNVGRNEAVNDYTLTADASGKIYTLSFDNGLLNRTTYSLAVSEGLSSVSGITLPDGYSATFTTENIKAKTENILTSTFDSSIDPWAMILPSAANPMVWKNGVVSTSILSKDEDGVPAQYSSGAIASNYGTYLRPSDWQDKYAELQNYSVAMDFSITNVYGNWADVGMVIRAHGDPVYVAALAPTGGYMVSLAQSNVFLKKFNSAGGSPNVQTAPYSLEYNTTYNLKTVADANTITVYIAKYTDGVMGAYEEVLSYTDTEDPALSGYFAVYERLNYNNTALNHMPTSDMAWMDNIVVDKIITPFYVDSASVQNNAENVSISEQISVLFSSDVSADSVAANIELKDVTSNTVVPQSAYTATVNGKSVTVQMNRGFTYNHKYTLTVKGTLEDIYGTELSLYQGGAYEISFTAEPEDVYIKTVNITDKNGNAIANLNTAENIKASVEIYNKTNESKSVWLMVAAFGANNRMLAVTDATFSAASGSTTKSFELENVPAGTETVRVFAWDSKESLTPYCSPKFVR